MISFFMGGVCSRTLTVSIVASVQVVKMGLGLELDEPDTLLDEAAKYSN